MVVHNKIMLKITSAKRNSNAVIAKSRIYYYILNKYCKTISLSKTENGPVRYLIDLTNVNFKKLIHINVI